MNQLAKTIVRPPTGRLDIRRASNGETFDITSDVWMLSATGNNCTFNFAWCDDALTPDLKAALKEVVALQLKRDGIGFVRGCFGAIKRLLEWMSAKHAAPVAAITKEDVTRYRLSDPCSTDTNIKYVVDRWMASGLPGIDLDTAEALAEIKQEKSERLHILTLDPEEGPHLEDEIAMVDRALQSAYEASRINDAQYVLVQIFRLYGQRPAMVANLKLGDLRTPRHHGVEASLRFEVLKQSKDKPRQHGPKRPAPMLFIFALENYLDQLTANAPAAAWDLDHPVFPAKTDRFLLSDKSSDRNRALNAQAQTASGYEGHATATQLFSRYSAILNSLGIVSLRTGKAMVFNPTRDRHTIATIMAMRGCTAEEIAAWLHHTDTNSCQAYVELAWQHHQLMSSLLDGRLVHVSGQFLGEVIENDLDGFASQTIITASELEDTPDLGACSAGGCRALDTLAAPYACFLCRNFNLSIDADLDPLLRLLVDRKKEAKRWGDDEYGRTINRHIAAVLAAGEIQQAARAARTEAS